MLKPRVLWAGASLALALVGWLVLRDSVAPDGSSMADRSAPAASNSAPALAGASLTTRAENDRPAFTTVLLPDQQITAIPGSVRIGIGRVSPDEARSYQEWIAGGSEGAGPASLAELATVERWIDAPSTALLDGTIRVGPLTLPQADRYDLQARGASPLHFYSVSFTADAYPANVSPTVAAGLRIGREPAVDSDVRVLLRRGSEVESAPVWQELMLREAPQLLAAFNEASLAVEPVQVLAPLPPGPLDVILEVDGIEAQRQSVTLVSGTVTDLQFDPVAQAVARAVAVQLQLSFVTVGTRRPIEGLQVTWTGGKIEQTLISDGAGVVNFNGVDRQRTQAFTLKFPATEGDLPIWPTQSAIEIALDGEPKSTDTPRLIRKTIELRPLQWLIVRTGAFPIPQNRRRGNPYPIFVLQHEQDGIWRDSAADHFIPVAEGIATSIQTPGRYRLAALQAPWAIWYSSTADTQAASADGRFPASLMPDRGRSVEITALSRGMPLTHAALTLRGPVRGLPATSINSDGAGRVRLEGVTVPAVALEVPGFAVVNVDLGAASATVELQAEAETAGDPL